MDFVAITSCPAGLAHTPMAAKALEKAAQELGLQAKVEQQGSDQKIEKMDRFEGIPAVRVDINMCIKKPKAVIDKVSKAVAARVK